MDNPYQSPSPKSNDGAPNSAAREILTSITLVALVAVGVLFIWAAIVKFQNLPPALLPSPSRVFSAALENRATIIKATFSTAIAACLGLVCAIGLGAVIAIAFSTSRKIQLAFFPYVIFLQTVPIVGIAPLLIIWSGYRFRTVVIATVIICLFPIISNTTAGLLAARSDLADLFRLYGSSRWQRLRSLQFPTAIPYLMLGARISSGLAVIGAIVAEFFVGNGSNYAGLGTLLTKWQGQLKTDALIAALFASTLLGLVLFGTVQLINSTILRRWTQTTS